MIKNIKITLLWTVVVFFVSIPNVLEAGHCSHVKKLSEKLQCTLGGDVESSSTSETSETSETSDKTKKQRGGEEIDTLEKLFKKLDKKKKELLDK